MTNCIISFFGKVWIKIKSWFQKGPDDDAILMEQWSGFLIDEDVTLESGLY